EKMASLGQLVAGVAHEINTPLGIALTSASYLADQTARLKELAGLGKMRKSDFEGFMSKAGEAAGLLVSNIGRVGDLVQGFKKIAVDEASDERRAFRLHARLEDVVASQAAIWQPAGHRFMLDCPPDLEMEGYPGVLSQILSDLVGNAVVHAYAPGQSGTLSLTARPLDGGMVELVFADDGRGIPAEHRGKVFDPFFTTRRGAGSTGLGLHIVYNLVTGKLGGRIDLDSEEGRGTRLSLRLPQVAG
ncbi:MAG: HAMP domain-containing histidine kinase, partial [Rhodospirillales bacterium]|nr:HAMP domain-containing histidine kinase [Rhodospirillales bacterium]